MLLLLLLLQYMWEAASHEIGHNMGLYHDGDQSTPYYEGHGIWAPIMVRLAFHAGALFLVAVNDE
jgi:hypothetical protein